MLKNNLNSSDENLKPFIENLNIYIDKLKAFSKWLLRVNIFFYGKAFFVVCNVIIKSFVLFFV